jgi:hypothetical protein
MEVRVTARRFGNVSGMLSIINAALLAWEMRSTVRSSELSLFGHHAITAMWLLTLLLPLIAAWKSSRFWLLCLIFPVPLYFYAMSQMV